MGTFDRLAGLTLRVEGYDLEPLEHQVSRSFLRLTTVVRLRGDGHEGRGEDPTYDAVDQHAFRRAPRLPLAGEYDLRSFSAALDRLDPFPEPPQQAMYRDYRRWAFESAALDLALRQAGLGLAEALGLDPSPVRFVASMGLGSPASFERLTPWIRRFPELRFKLDADASWTDELIARLGAEAAVDVVDFKGAYHGTTVDQPPDAELYDRVARGLPGALLEDPGWTAATREVLAGHMDRVTWDAPIHSVDDIRALEHPPRVLNFKPSRFGTIEALLEAYDHCRREGIAMYGGGQFELGPGRGQIQLLASLFHADAPNDVAPGDYNRAVPPDDAESSPLDPRPARVGFARAERDGDATLSGDELALLVRRVFRPRPGDRRLALLVDLPDETVPDNPDWRTRRQMASHWWRELGASRESLGLEAVDLICYRNVHSNNADFPAEGFRCADGNCPPDAASAGGETVPFERILAGYQLLIAPTEFSATAPLKLNARKHGFRAATMPGFKAAMIPALRLDYVEVQRRCDELKALLDRATDASFVFEAAGRERRLRLDLRHRQATASGGMLTEPGTAGNLPSGETYIVPYEGEREGDPSRSSGELPLELGGELMTLRIDGNRVVEVEGPGPRAAAERQAFSDEPAYANVAELGLGLLSDYGVEPVGELLLDEKLGLHIAFGRSDHFGGTVGAADFSSPERVVHIDRVYIPAVQPGVRVRSVELQLDDGKLTLIRDDRYVI